MTNLAGTLETLGRTDESEQLLKRALAIGDELAEAT